MRASALRWSPPACSGAEQKEQQVDRLAVVAFEWNGVLQACEQAGNGFDVRQLHVRDRDPASEARRTQPFTLQQCCKNVMRAGACCRFGPSCQSLKRLLLVLSLQSRDDPVLGEHVFNIHSSSIRDQIAVTARLSTRPFRLLCKQHASTI